MIQEGLKALSEAFLCEGSPFLSYVFLKASELYPELKNDVAGDFGLLIEVIREGIGDEDY